ncbi:MAG: PKD domain protein [Methanoregulaceae archaeon PtaU1.Bin059]|nr:MAG: PKD domain protein [Methanoregulaceae archaeon PtaU1.Bin059]
MLMVTAILLLAVCLVAPVMAATTSVEIRKYANDGTTILNQTTVNYTWMMNNLPVLGDGVTHYYHQGPVFVDDPDPETQAALRWNPEEDTNVEEKDMGAVKGTNLKDLCDLVGGMSPGEEVKILSSDGWNKRFAYENVYGYSSREGPIVICWYKNGMYPDSGYTEGMRMVWFADNSTNPWGYHAFGNWDWHEAADEQYWYYYQQGDEKYPTTTGLSGQVVNRIFIYSDDPVPTAPEAGFTSDIQSGTAPLTVQFTDESTNTPTSWAWDFENDGIVDSAEQNPSHVYGTPGTYTVNLTVTNSAGSDSEIKTDYITVISPVIAPVAAFTSDVQSGSAPLTVQFTDDSTNTPTSWAWDFENDGIVDSAEQNPSHVYDTPGTYTVNLTVTNSAGSDSEIKTDYITVISPVIAPVAAFTSDVQSGTAPLTVQFTDDSTNTPTSWAWDFENDGIVDSAEQNPSHVYDTPGTYTVNLTVTNAVGSDSEVKADYITVTSPPSIDELFNGTVTLTEGETFTVTAYNTGGGTYSVNRTTPLGALDTVASLQGFTYDVTDKNFASSGALLLDNIGSYCYHKTPRKAWYAYVNEEYKDGYNNPAGALNLIALNDGDTVEFYFVEGTVADPTDYAAVTAAASAAVKIIAEIDGSTPTEPDWILSLSGARTQTVTKTYFEQGLACPSSGHMVSYTDGEGNVWGGVPLWLLVAMVDDNPDTGPYHYNFNDALAAEGYSVKVTAGDGYSINFASSDIARNSDYIVANTLNGEPLPLIKPNSTKLCFPLQMIGPAVSSGQLVGNITSIELVGLPEPPTGWTLRMEGDVVDTITQAEFEEALACIHSSTYNDGTDVWGGIPLWVLIGAVDDIETSSHWTFNDTRAAGGYTIRVIAGDGYNRTFASGDVARSGNYIVANTKNGEPLTDSIAPLRLVGASVTGGARVGNIETIRLEGLPGYPAGDWSLQLDGAISDIIPQPEFEYWASCHSATYDDGAGNIYEGIPLWRLMGWVDDRTPHGSNGFNNTRATAGYKVIITAGDGYSKELMSQMIGTDNRFIVANKVNGELLAGPKAPLQLVGSGLPSASYSVGNIARIELTDFQEPTEIPTVTIIKYASDGTTILNQTTVDHTWMEAHLPVIGDGITHYMFQGVTFDPADLWDPTETKGMAPPKIDNAIKGTRVRDICDLVGGMEPGTEIKFVSNDGYETTLPYDAIYPNPHVYSHLGESVIAWYADGNYVPQYGDGPRLFFTPEDHVVGQWDMHEALPEQYWHYYWSGGVQYPSVAGLSAKYISTIKIYSAPVTDWVLVLDGEDIGGLNQTISRNYFESALACQFGANHEAEYTDSAGRTWSGMPLWFLAGFVDDNDQHSNNAFNDTLAAAGYDVIVTARDGYTITLPSEQIIRNNNYLVANALNGTTIAEADSNWPLRLTGQNVTAGMTVKGVASIRLVSRHAGNEPEIKIVPTQSALPINSTAQYQILLSSAPDGLAGYDLYVTLENPAVGEIIAVQYPDWAGLNNTIPSPPADSLRLSAVDLDKSVEAGAEDVLLATITVYADSTGNSTITVSNVHMDADGGSMIEPGLSLGEVVVYTPMIVDFEANVTFGKASLSRPLFIAFTDLSTGIPPGSSWLWDFDNNGVVDSTEQNPVTSYVNPGNYTVSLTVHNTYSSDTETKSEYIRITRYVKPFPGLTDDPTDPDGDYLYEDINGNGRLDYDDIVLYYENMQWIRDQLDVGIEPYDYNGNGRIDYDDVVVLYQELLASHP